MARISFVLCIVFAVCAIPTSSLRADWSEDFDSYPVGPLDGHGGWEAWGSGGGQSGAMVSSQVSRSAPNSCAIDAGDDVVHEYAGYDSGIWSYSAWQFIPADAEIGKTYFILLNSYDGGGDETNWSTQVSFDPDLEIVESESEGEMQTLVKGEWVEIRVVIDLVDDYQRIYYDDRLLSSKGWTDGVSGGGELNIAAVDLWGDEAEYETYYDDISLTAQPGIGACCLDDGNCIDSLTPEECEGMSGEYKGTGSQCAFVDCPIWGDCGIFLYLPDYMDWWVHDTSEWENDCDLRPSKDAQFEIHLLEDGEWTFSVCDAGWDTYLYLGTECCSADVAESDDHPDCGDGSKIVIELEAGTYYLTVEGKTADDEGAFVLEVTKKCEIECPNGSIFEGEWDQCEEGYVDDFNSGCNYDGDPKPFSPIECGDVVCGWTSTFTGWTGGTRDSDWYEFDLFWKSYVTWEVIGEVDMQTLMIDAGDGTCEDGTYEIIGSMQTEACWAESMTRSLHAGKWWLWVGPTQFEGAPCPSIYIGSLTCIPACAGDITGPEGAPDEMVDVLDLILMLGQWGSDGYADITGPDGEPDGVVDVLDLILLLSNWGPC